MLQQEPHAETLAQPRDNKVVDLPSSRPLRLEQAIAAFDSRDNSINLYQEFESLASVVAPSVGLPSETTSSNRRPSLC